MAEKWNEPRCPKCGDTWPGPTWHGGNGHFYEQRPCSYYSLVRKDAVAEGEHLHYRCSCGWEWLTKTKDSA